MLLSETVWSMDTRQIAGSIVRDELARQGWKHDKASQAMHMAKSTLYRVMDGEPNVQEMTLRQVEGLLKLPRRFLSLVIANDQARIESLDTIDADLRRHTLDALSDAGDTVTRSKRA